MGRLQVNSNIDQYFNNVSLLLPFDNNFNDFSKNNFSVTANGNAQISTAESKFGGAAGYFDGIDETYLQGSIGNDLLDGDMTIEAWVWLSNTSNSKTLINPSPHNSIGISLNRDNTGYTYVFIGDGSDWIASIQSSNTLSHSTWHHVVVSVQGNTTRLFHNGTLVGSENTKPSGNINFLRIGAITWEGGFNDENFNGYIDDFRLTKGIARYTSNFIPPSKLPLNINNKISIKPVSYNFYINASVSEPSYQLPFQIPINIPGPIYAKIKNIGASTLTVSSIAIIFYYGQPALGSPYTVATISPNQTKYFVVDFRYLPSEYVVWNVSNIIVKNPGYISIKKQNLGGGN